MVEQPDIVVTAFTPRFVAACARVIGIEGGYVNNAVDRGGATRYGISLRFLVQAGKLDPSIGSFDLDGNGDLDGADIRRLTPADARLLYWRFFWQPMGCEAYPAPLGEAMFDQGVNCSAKAAAKELQVAVNRVSGAKLPIDGQIGPRTRTALVGALAKSGMPALMAAFRVAAADRYRAIAAADPHQAQFLNGWLHRAGELGVA